MIVENSKVLTNNNTGKRPVSFVHGFFHIIDKASEVCGKIAGGVGLIIMALTTIEVISRYVFNQPTSFVWPINKQLFAVMVLFAGIYVMRRGNHLRIEILYDRLQGRARFAADVLAFICFALFMGMVIWQSCPMALRSLSDLEKSSGAFRMPLYPVKALIPVGSLLFLFEGISRLIKQDNE